MPGGLHKKSIFYRTQKVGVLLGSNRITLRISECNCPAKCLDDMTETNGTASLHRQLTTWYAESLLLYIQCGNIPVEMYVFTPFVQRLLVNYFT
jgi:hypothetical protein